MELKKGYKQTNVGIIPSDWEVKSIAEIVNVDPENLGSSTNPNFAFKYISLEDVDYGILRNISEVVFKDAPSRARRKLKKDDILVSTVRPNLKSHLHISKDVLDWVCSTGFSVLRSKVEFNSTFLYNHFFASIINTQIDNLITGSNYPSINSREIKALQIPLPPTKSEQTAIATALSDADALISSLEKLIEKKRNIKQSLIKQLLLGIKRLKGFNGSWVEKPFPQVCWYQEGPGLRNWQFTSGGIKVINVTNLVDGYLNLERTARHISWDEFNKMYKHFEIDPLDIVVASSGNSYAKVAVVRKRDLPLVMNTSVIRFKPLKELDYNFLLAFLNSNLFKDQIDLLITGGAQPNFGPFHLNKISIKVPPTKEEQIVIGNIIKDAEDEIECLVTKLSKAKLFKQGMMQELLTGKIRLV
jgi:type I restriction enzyme S subunit